MKLPYAAEGIAVAVAAALVALPSITHNLFAFSMATQVAWAITAALSVYVMLRVDLLTFATPAFMAMGGYAAALLETHGVSTNAVVLALASFVVPAGIAVPLGVLILRLRGTYFVLITFVLSEIFELVIFNSPTVLGGANGLPNLPSPTLAGQVLQSNAALVRVSTVLCLTMVILVAAFIVILRPWLASIEDNEPLAESLGLPAWRYKALAFAISSGVAGVAGFILVNSLSDANPASFNAISSVNYIAFVVVGGRLSILGPVIGSMLLVYATNELGSQGQYAPGLYGLLIIVVVLFAKTGIVGSLEAALLWLQRKVHGARMLRLEAHE